MFTWFYRRIDKIYYGWWMVAIGSTVRIVAGGLRYYGSSIFFLPVSQELGLSRAATSLVFSLARAQGALEEPLAGYIIDRHGPRPVILAAMFFTGAIPANWFVRNRGIAMAWMSASIGLGGLLVAPILAYTVYTWGGLLGPVAAGFLYDRTQNHRAILWTLLVVLAITSGAYATLVKPKNLKDMTHG